MKVEKPNNNRSVTPEEVIPKQEPHAATWLGKAWSSVSSSATLSGCANVAIAAGAAVAAGGIIASAFRGDGDGEGVAQYAGAAASLAFLARGVGCALGGDRAKAMKCLFASCVIGGLAWQFGESIDTAIGSAVNSRKSSKSHGVEKLDAIHERFDIYFERGQLDLEGLLDTSVVNTPKSCNQA